MPTELKIRGLDPDTIEAIDRRAKYYGMSRNAYLASLLTNYTAQKEMETYVARYEALVQEMISAIKRNTDALTRYLSLMEET